MGNTLYISGGEGLEPSLVQPILKDSLPTAHYDHPPENIQVYRYVQGYESASKRAFVISIAFGLMSQPIKFRFNSLQTTAVVPLPK